MIARFIFPADVVQDFDFKANFPQLGGNGVGVVDRFFKFYNALIIIVPDHQRDTTLGRGHYAATQQQ
ncbi:MAG: hypothetical protein IPN98_03590 [Propionivibrio sp.]|nr:hypothetical protein [Propionivibrio sp.]